MLNRFFVKQVGIFVVYDRLTGTIVGDTVATAEVVKRVLTPKGFTYDERMEASEAKIPSGSEELFHKEVVRLRYSTAADKAFEDSKVKA